ncbi:MAG: PQQ-binding-like beta-propeller repeat protein [Gammaproteobacteria bacterium]|nr:PQQ-binding-like beta-propeller repeat protein [Gammaproteobacteria bacterium]
MNFFLKGLSFFLIVLNVSFADSSEPKEDSPIDWQITHPLHQLHYASHYLYGLSTAPFGNALYAIDAEKGKIEWKFQAGDFDGELVVGSNHILYAIDHHFLYLNLINLQGQLLKRIYLGDIIKLATHLNSMIIDHFHQLLLVTTSNGDVLAFNLSGELKWIKRHEAIDAATHLIVTHNQLWFQTKHTIYSLQPENGQVITRRAYGEDLQNMLVSRKNLILVSGTAKKTKIHAYDVQAPTKIMWMVNYPYLTDVALDHTQNILYVTVQKTEDPLSQNKLYALDATSSKILWQTSLTHQPLKMTLSNNHILIHIITERNLSGYLQVVQKNNHDKQMRCYKNGSLGFIADDKNQFYFYGSTLGRFKQGSC